MNFFDHSGRCIPAEGMRVFSREPRNFYKLQQPNLEYELILKRSKKENIVSADFEVKDFKIQTEILIEKIRNNIYFKNILNGVFVPFVFKRQLNENDLGSELVDILLPKLKSSFINAFPKSEFKAILQSNTELRNSVKLDPNSRYSQFIKASEERNLVGLYFPQIFQGFDVSSQRLQMKYLPDFDDANYCLSGGIDICAALIGSPELLFNQNFYTPIPIMSAYVHHDDRMVLLVKAYGPHLEFWCMSQMLKNNITQVSEQWTGSLVFF